MRLRVAANPPSRFLNTHLEYEEGDVGTAGVEVIEDSSRSILSHNDSPDIGFDWSVNPYRGCVHACAYCYARPTHEYLGLGAGTDFDTKIHVKSRAAALLRDAFDARRWRGELVVFSGVTDCYQPLEARLRLTRACLEVCAEYRNPVAVITKAPLVERDIDVLQDLTRNARVHVRVSVPFWSEAQARAIEPWVATPRRRIQTIERLAAAGVSVGVNVAPIIPGLSDSEVPQVLRAARDAGATRASFVLLRLPGPVKAVFEERLRRAFPERAEKVLARIRDTRGGELYDARFGRRGRGTGAYAASIQGLFETTARKLGFEMGLGAEPGPSSFRRPPRPGEQLALV